MIEKLFLSVGAMKAGTTWLYEQLKDHPNIVSTPQKEIHYFEHVSGSTRPIPFAKRKERMIQAIADKNPSYVANQTHRIQWYLNYGSQELINDVWYQDLFGRAANDPSMYCADYSNLYALLPQKGWQRVRQNCKQLRVVYTLRDPLARVWSHYKFHMQFIGKGESILKSGTDGFIEMISKDWFWQHACYDLVLERLSKFVEPDELGLFYFEDFRSKPQQTVDNLCAFLSLDTFALNPKASEPVNVSGDIKMPDEWQAIAIEKLKPTFMALEKRGMFHESWSHIK